jgi:hypothetical protein
VATTQPTNFFLGSTPFPTVSTSAADVALQFSFKLDQSWDTAQHRSPVLVSTFYLDSSHVGHGISFELTPSRELQATIGSFDPPPSSAYVVSKPLPAGQWTTATLAVTRSRGLDITVNGQQEYRYTDAGVGWSPLPGTAQVGGSNGQSAHVAIRDLSLGTTLLGTPNPNDHLFLIRVLQLLGAVSLVFGAIQLLRRYLSPVVPVAQDARRSLVLIVFGTAGLGILANIATNMAHAQSTPYSYMTRNSWLPWPVFNFHDFVIVYGLLRSLNPYTIHYAGSYPPVAYWLMWPFTRTSLFSSVWIYIVLFLSVFWWWLARSFTACLRSYERIAVVIVATLSYPATLAVAETNIDLLLFVFLLIGIASIERRRDGVAVVMLALIAVSKVVPALYILLFAVRRQWGRLVQTVGLALILTAAGFAAFHGGFVANVRGFLSALRGTESLYNDGVHSAEFSSTLASWSQAVANAIGGNSASVSARTVVSHYQLIEEAVGILLLFVYLRRESVLWRATTLITIAILLLPDVSYDYTLIYLFVPIALFVRQERVDGLQRKIAVVFGLLLAPHAYWYIDGSLISTQTFITAPLLLVLAGMIVRHGVLDRRATNKSKPEIPPRSFPVSSSAAHSSLPTERSLGSLAELNDQLRSSRT